MNKFTAIDPAGKVHTRNSKTRTYTHMVVGLPSSVGATRAAMSPEARKMHRSNFKYHEAILAGVSKHLVLRSWQTFEMHVERVVELQQRALADLNGCDAVEEYVQMKIEATLEAIRHSMARGYYDTYQDLGWCGRADLAAKRKVSSENSGWVDVKILEAVKGQ